eukprot:PhF_6_TR13861/c0_g1_i2/m.22232
MITATEQQLRVITAKTDKLESSMTEKIEEVKRLKRDRDELDMHTQQLREALATAEGKLSSTQMQLDDATASLRVVASEYSKAQLLKKKYMNLVNELKGHPRVVLRVVCPPSAKDLTTNPGQHEFGVVTIADECTVNIPSKSKSFVFDSVISPTQDTSEECFARMNGEAMVVDALNGYNVSTVTFGQRGSSKTSQLCGSPRVFSGLIPMFIQSLFQSFDKNEVTHYNVKMMMFELIHDQVGDLLVDAGVTGQMQTSAVDIARDQRSIVHVNGLHHATVTSAAQGLSTFQFGLKQRDKRRQLSGTVGIPARGGHMVLYIDIDTYNAKGNYRKGRLSFVDLLGGDGAGTREGQWVNKSLTALGDVISALSAAASSGQPQVESSPPSSSAGTSTHTPSTSLYVPYRNHKLTQLLSDAFGGNAKCTLLCSVVPSSMCLEDVLTTLIYGFHTKAIRNTVYPFDIPPELQRLNEEIGSLGIE